MDKLVYLLTAILLTDYRNVRGHNASCIENYQCVPLARCHTSTTIVYPCNEAQTAICCAVSNITPNKDEDDDPSVVLRTTAFPDTCGVFTSADRITGGERAGIGQFPWMALLGYKQEAVEFIQFLCGGSLITQEYVLTAAHCISIDVRLKLGVVRFGELDLESAIDCESAEGEEKTCADPPVDVPVDITLPHENYNNKTLENDIALVRLKKKVPFTDYIQPICLPFKKDIKDKLHTNDKLTVSGWGKTSSANVGGSSILQYTEVKVWDQGRCNVSVPPRIRPVRESQLCANGVRKQDACKGDSGGPLFNSTIISTDFRYYQVGVVSFSSAQICGNAELPTIYTRVEYFMNWIVTNVVVQRN